MNIEINNKPYEQFLTVFRVMSGNNRSESEVKELQSQ